MYKDVQRLSKVDTTRFWVLSTASKGYMNNLISVILLDTILHQVGLKFKYVIVLSFN